MKNYLLGLVLVLGFSVNSNAAQNSVYTDVKKDCVVVSQSNEKSEIDFLDSQCKSFGGYSLSIAGSDLRYGPELFYNGVKIELNDTYRFHNLGSNKVEWVYESQMDEDGSGSLTWVGMIYRLDSQKEITDEDQSPGDESLLYTVRLAGEKSCVIGVSKTNKEARALLSNPNEACRVLE